MYSITQHIKPNLTHSINCSSGQQMVVSQMVSKNNFALLVCRLHVECMQKSLMASFDKLRNCNQVQAIRKTYVKLCLAAKQKFSIEAPMNFYLFIY